MWTARRSAISLERTAISAQGSRNSRSSSGRSKDVDRQDLGEILDKLAAPARRDFGDQGARRVTCNAFEQLQRLRHEGRHQQFAIGRVPGRIETERQRMLIDLVAGEVEILVAEMLVIDLDDVEVGRTRRDPVAAIVRRPDDVGALVKLGPGQLNVLGLSRKVEEIEIDDQVGRHMIRNDINFQAHVALPRLPWRHAIADGTIF